MADNLGKQAEKKIKEWLDRPQDGYCFDRIPDQMTGFYMVSRNVSDFICYKYPNFYYIESKSTEHDRFSFDQLTDTQRNGLAMKSNIHGCWGIIIVLFITYKRAFVFNIKDIVEFIDNDTTRLKVKSINIKKIDKWDIPYKEIRTCPSRKLMLDYIGEIEEYVPQ